MAASPRSNTHISEFDNSQLMQDFSDDLDNMPDVADDELNTILESKTEFIELPTIANGNHYGARDELMQESRFVYANQIELLPSTVDFLDVPIEIDNPKLKNVALANHQSLKHEIEVDQHKTEASDVDKPDKKYLLERAKADLEACKHQLEIEIDKNSEKDERLKQLNFQIEHLNGQSEEQRQLIAENKTLINRLEIEKQALLEKMQLTQYHDESITTAKLEGLMRENNRLADDLHQKTQLLRDKESLVERLTGDLLDLQRSQDKDTKIIEIELHKARLTSENLEKHNEQLLSIIEQLKSDLINSRIEAKDLEVKMYMMNDRNYQLTSELSFAKSQIETLRMQLQESMLGSQGLSRQLEYKINDLQHEFSTKNKERDLQKEREHERERERERELEQRKYLTERNNYNSHSGIDTMIKAVQNYTSPNFYPKKTSPDYELEDNRYRVEQIDSTKLEGKRQAYTRADRAKQRQEEEPEVPKTRVDRIPKKQAPDKPSLIKTEKEKTPHEIEKEHLEVEITSLQDKRREMENEFNTLNKNTVKSGMLIKRKKELESELLFVNKNLSSLKNKLRIMKHEYY